MGSGLWCGKGNQGTSGEDCSIGGPAWLLGGFDGLWVRRTPAAREGKLAGDRRRPVAQEGTLSALAPQAWWFVRQCGRSVGGRRQDPTVKDLEVHTEEFELKLEGQRDPLRGLGQDAGGKKGCPLGRLPCKKQRPGATGQGWPDLAFGEPGEEVHPSLGLFLWSVPPIFFLFSQYVLK